MNSRVLVVAAFACGTIATASCSNSAAEPRKVLPTIEIVSGADVTDTIGAWLSEPLTVLVRDSTGRPAALTPVVFAVVPVPGSPDPFPSYAAYVNRTSYAGEPSPQPALTEWTDEEGRAEVKVRFGTISGPVRIAVTSPDLPVHDTASFTVRPGAAVRLDVQPADSSVYVGYRYAFRVRSLDRADNTRPDSVSLSGGDSVLALDGTSGVKGQRYGRDFTDVSTATHTARVWTSVVPQGTIAFTFSGYSIEEGIGVINLDGSGRRRVFGSQEYLNSAHSARWSRDGKSLIAVQGGDSFVIDFATGTWRAPASIGAILPVLSPDAQWIYYSTAQQNQYSLWRVPVDVASAAERLPVGIQYVSHKPDISPDGTRMAYVGGDGYEHEMLLADSSDHRIGNLSGLANGPRYSPDGTMVAFTRSMEFNSYYPENGVYVIGVQGSSPRRISPPSFAGQPSTYTLGGTVSWSPDGQWVIAGTYTGLRITNVQTGLTIPLPWSKGDYAEPDWRPAVGP